ncbi:MAG TPA: type II toxin-antitoxin system VapC family toxin [Gaiella sp.]|nr:type II toxin-antitoxin system VapC family toxin [Gaiella sp.]
MTPTAVLDASAVVALAHNEPGADAVAPRVDGACISTVNWSEVARVSVAVGRDPADLHALLVDAGCQTIDFTVDDATLAARLWESTRDEGLSLADRACLALAKRLGIPALTADRAWTRLDVGVEVIAIR